MQEIKQSDTAIMDAIFNATNVPEGLTISIKEFAEKKGLNYNRTSQFVTAFKKCNQIEEGVKIPNATGHAHVLKWCGWENLTEKRKRKIYDKMNGAKHPGNTPHKKKAQAQYDASLSKEQPRDAAVKLLASINRDTQALHAMGYQQDETGRWYKETREYL